MTHTLKRRLSRAVQSWHAAAIECGVIVEEYTLHLGKSAESRTLILRLYLHSRVHLRGRGAADQERRLQVSLLQHARLLSKCVSRVHQTRYAFDGAIGLSA